MLHDFAFKNPDFYATNAVSRHRFGNPIVNISAQCMQRHTPLTIPFSTRNLGAAQTTTAINTDAERTKAHGRLHGPLHGTTETNPTLQLLRDALSSQLGIHFGFANLDDVHHNFAVRHAGDFVFQLFNIGAFFADNHAGAGRMNGDAAFFVRTLNNHARDTGLPEIPHQRVADFEIFMQQSRIIALAGVPARLPCTVYAQTHANRIDLLTHYAFSSTSRTTMVSWLNGLMMRAARPLARARNRFITRFLPT